MAKAGRITIDLDAGTAKFLVDMDKANAKLQQFGKNAESSSLSFRYAFNGVKDLLEGRVNNAIAEAANELAGLRGAALAIGGATAGLAAIGFVAYEVKKHFDEIAEASAKMQAQFREINNPLATTNDELKLANDRLANSIAKLEGRHENTLATQLDEARVMADKLADSLDKDLDRLSKLLKEETRGGFNAFIHGEAATSDLREELVGKTGYGGFRSKLAEADGDPTKSKDLLDEEIVKFEAMAVNENLKKLGANPTDSSKRVEFINEILRVLSAERERIDQTTTNVKLAGQKEQLEASKGYAKQEEQALKAGYDRMLADLESSDTMLASEKLAFRQDELSEISQYGNKYKDLQHELSNEIGHLSQEDFAAGAAARKKDEEDERRFQEKLADLKVDWAKRGYEAVAATNKRLSERSTEPRPDIPQIPIEGNARTRLAGTVVGNGIALSGLGYKSLAEQQASVEEAKRALAVMQEMKYPLGQQIEQRAKILQMESSLREELTGELQQQQLIRDAVEERLKIGTLKSGWDAFFIQMQERAKQPGQILFEGMNAALDRLSENLAEFVTGGKTNFAQMFKDIGRQMAGDAIKSGLQRGLNAVGQALGINIPGLQKRDGQTNKTALLVEDIGTSGLAPAAAAATLGNVTSNINLGPIFTGSQGGGIFNLLGKVAGMVAGAFAGGVGGGGGSTPSVSSSISYDGARANGGLVSPSSAYLVGEDGPEIITGASGRVHSNADSRRMLGSGETHNYYVNAAAGVSRQEMYQAIMAAHGSSVSTGVQANVEFSKRRPGGQ